MEINLGEIIFSIINFLILLFILYKFMWKPVVRTMDGRQKGIQESLDQAAAARKEAEETQAALAAEIANARRQAKEIVDEAQVAAEQVKQDIIKQAEEAAQAVSARAQAEIERKQEEALAQIKGEVADLIVLATTKLLEDNVSIENQKALVDKYIAEVGDR